MTQYLLDIASYQAGLNLSVAKSAGFSLVNIKTSQGNFYTYGAARSWADQARALGMGICTFHWLDNSASGATQASIAYQRMKDVGGPDAMAHQCDCEDNASWTILRDYVNAMQDKLGRHLVIYTGDWWWAPGATIVGHRVAPTRPQWYTARQADDRPHDARRLSPAGLGGNWDAGGLTPHLWAAPNTGYLTVYPGDTSSKWHAGFGGWAEYSLLQYAVSGIAGAGGGQVSKTAIRDPAVWATLTGGGALDMDPKGKDIVAGVENARVFNDMWVWLAMIAQGTARRADDRFGTENPAPRWHQEVVDKLAEMKAAPVPSPAVAFTDEQVTAFAAQVGTALVNRTDNPLGPPDLPIIVQGVKDALRDIVTANTPGTG